MWRGEWMLICGSIWSLTFLPIHQSKKSILMILTQQVIIIFIVIIIIIITIIVLTITMIIIITWRHKSIIIVSVIITTAIVKITWRRNKIHHHPFSCCSPPSPSPPEPSSCHWSLVTSLFCVIFIFSNKPSNYLVKFSSLATKLSCKFNYFVILPCQGILRIPLYKSPPPWKLKWQICEFMPQSSI